MQLKAPKNLEINGKVFVVSKFPAVAGREIMTQYLPTALPKVGNYKENERLMLELMKYVGVKSGDITVPLETLDLVNNHAGDWEVLIQLERAMIEYNGSFFQDGRASNFLAGLFQNIPALISKILTGLSVPSSPQESPPSTS